MRRLLLFSPASLLKSAERLATDTDPPAEKILCNPEDYRDAGLRRQNGPVTYIAHVPERTFAQFNQPVQAPFFRKTAIEPDDRCARGEIVDPRP